METKKIIVHKGYVIKTLKNDIALIMLKKSLDSTYMPACLAPKLSDYTGKVASLYGWGAIADTKLGNCRDKSDKGSVQRCLRFSATSSPHFALKYLPQVGQSSFEEDDTNHHK